MTSSIKTVAPIVFWKTRSFWLGWLPALVTILNVAFGELMTGSPGPVSTALFYVVGHFLPVSAEEISNTMLKIAPLYALIVAQQRAGLTRPYTTSPEKERAVVEIVENGLDAFEAGRAAGQALRRKSQ